MDMPLLKLMISVEGGLFDNKPAFPFFIYCMKNYSLNIFFKNCGHMFGINIWHLNCRLYAISTLKVNC